MKDRAGQKLKEKQKNLKLQPTQTIFVVSRKLSTLRALPCRTMNETFFSLPLEKTCALVGGGHVRMFKNIKRDRGSNDILLFWISVTSTNPSYLWQENM